VTEAQMQERILELERVLAARTHKRIDPSVRKAAKAAKIAERKRRAQFRLDRWRRERRHLSLNRYAITH
jgi:hypothetical protein